MNADKLLQDIKAVADFYKATLSIKEGDIYLKYDTLGYGYPMLNRLIQVLKKNGVEGTVNLNHGFMLIIISVECEAEPIDFEKVGVHYDG